MKVRSLFGIALIVAGTIFVISSTLFISQGGFGGGHARFDQILYFLSMPWPLLMGKLPSLWIHGDYLPIVLLPLLFNVGTIAFLWTAVRRAVNRPKHN